VAGRAAWYLPGWLDRLLPRVSHTSEPPDPIEAELDQIVQAEEVHKAPVRSVDPRHVVPDPADSAAAPGVTGSLEPAAALRALEQALAESRELAEHHARLQREHAVLRERYDAVVDALRTLQEISAGRGR
jgi:hypothetical protein